VDFGREISKVGNEQRCKISNENQWWKDVKLSLAWQAFLWGSGAKNCIAKNKASPSFIIGSRPIFRAGKTPKLPFLVFPCSQTPRKRLQRRLSLSLVWLQSTQSPTALSTGETLICESSMKIFPFFRDTLAKIGRKWLSHTPLLAMPSWSPPPEHYWKIKANTSIVTLKTRDNEKRSGLVLNTSIVYRLKSLGRWVGKSATADATNICSPHRSHDLYPGPSPERWKHFSLISFHSIREQNYVYYKQSNQLRHWTEQSSVVLFEIDCQIYRKLFRKLMIL